MSGRRIDDHSFWAGGKSKGSVFPEGVKLKEERSVEGAGYVGTEYPDTTDKIYRDQKGGVKKAESYPLKPGYRQ
jgi:hypothetical protein